MKKELLLGLCLFSLISLNSQVSEPSKLHGLKRGAYINFNEFVSNNPSIADSFYIETIGRSNKNWQGTYSCTPKYTETNRRVKKIWGFCDGTRAYIYHEKEFFPIEIEEDQYWFVGYGRVETAGATTAGAVLGGAIGGGIAASIALAKAHSKKIKYVYDINSGKEISPYPTLPKTWNLLGTTIYFYRRDKKQSEETLEFIVNDSIHLSLIPNGFESMFFQLGSPPVKVCCGKNYSECFVVEVQKNEIKYVEGSIPEKDPIPKLVEVDASDGIFYSSGPKKAQEKRKPQGVKSSIDYLVKETLNLTGTTLIFYRRDKKESFEEFEFIVNDSLHISFIPNSYENLFFELGSPSVKICYGQDFSDCITVEVLENETKYFKCSLSEKDFIPKLIEVNETDGVYFSAKPKKEQEQRGNIKYQ